MWVIGSELCDLSLVFASWELSFMGMSGNNPQNMIFVMEKACQIPSFICLLARLALLCVVNRIFSCKATNKIPTIKSFPCSSTTTTVYVYTKEKTLFHHSPEHKSQWRRRRYEKDSSSAKRAPACLLLFIEKSRTLNTQKIFINFTMSDFSGTIILIHKWWCKWRWAMHYGMGVKMICLCTIAYHCPKEEREEHLAEGSCSKRRSIDGLH